MEYNENEMVTISLERYEEIKDTLLKREELAKKIDSCYTLSGERDNIRVFVNTSKFAEVLKEIGSGSDPLYMIDRKVTSVVFDNKSKNVSELENQVKLLEGKLSEINHALDYDHTIGIREKIRSIINRP